MSKKLNLPEIPRFPRDKLEEYRLAGDAMYPCVESVRSLAVALNTTIGLRENTDQFKQSHRSVRWRVSIGHCTKALKLLTSAFKLACENKYAESVNLLAQQAQRTIIQGLWLTKCSKEELDTYLVSSLSSEKVAYERIKRHGNAAQKQVAETHYPKLFEKAGFNIETFEPSYNPLPTSKEMLAKLGLDDHRLTSGLDLLGYHQARTSYVDLVSFHLEEKDGEFELDAEQREPKPYHLSLITLPFCHFALAYIDTYLTLEEVRFVFREYFEDFYKWLAELNDFLFERMLADPNREQSPPEKKKAGVQETSIEDHKRVGKELIAPFSAMNFTNKSWLHERLPEMLWAMALIKGLGRDEALELFRAIANKFKGREDLDGDVTFSGIERADSKIKEEIFDLFKSTPGAVEALSHLHFLGVLPGIKDWPLVDPKDEQASLNFIGECLLRGAEHQSQDATDCRWVRLACLVAAGKLIFRTEKDYREIFEYPNYGDQTKVRPTIRASEISFDTKSGKWIEEFWDKCFKATACRMPPSDFPTQKLLPTHLTEESLKKIYEELRTQYLKTIPSTFIEPKHDSIWGTALFSTGLALEILDDCDDGVLGLLGLRVIAESVINLKYLVTKNDPELWKRFRDYGAGKAKLSSLKLDTPGATLNYLPIKKLKEIANEDRWQEFVNMDIGDWSKENLRDRAKQADAMEIYNAYYDWPSCFTHAQWGAIRFQVFGTCHNPFHRFHRVPIMPQPLRTVRYDLERLIVALLDVVNGQYSTDPIRLVSN